VFALLRSGQFFRYTFGTVCCQRSVKYENVQFGGSFLSFLHSLRTVHKVNQLRRLYRPAFCIRESADRDSKQFTMTSLLY
jgi:hypothetical protein